MRSTSNTPELASSEPWTVGEIARRAQCTLRAIRFYEQRGLLSAGVRTGGRHRRYSSADLERLNLIVELRRAGMSLDEIRALGEIKRRHATGAAASLEFRGLLEDQISAIGARVTELLRIKSELQQLRRAMSICADCHRRNAFPDACAKCESFINAADSNPLMRALWSHS
jgi:DNA-binding transcriptional MerR regulator